MKLDPKTDIFLLKENGQYRDRTEDILFYTLFCTGVYSVEFRNKQGTFYRYSMSQVLLGRNGEEVPCLQLKVDELVYDNFWKVLVFPSIGLLKVIFHDGTSRFFPQSRCEIASDVLRESCSAKNILDYYRALSEKIDGEESDDDQPRFMQSQFQRLEQVNSQSVLGCYLSNNWPRSREEHPLYFPFAFNRSQFSAVRNALKNPVSVIEGPPGTGKTQTILNIVANAIIQGESVAVCSNNNSALENVVEKMDEEGYGYLAAMLGNNVNVETFFAEAHPLPHPGIAPTPYRDHDYLEALKAKLSLGELQNQYQLLLDEKAGLEKEQKVYSDLHPSNDRFSRDPVYQKRFHRANAGEFLTLAARLENRGKESFGFFAKFYWHFHHRIPWRLLAKGPLDLYDFCFHRYYERSLQDLQEKIDKLSLQIKEWSRLPYNDIILNYSKSLFSAALTRTVALEKEGAFAKDNYKKDFKKFTKRFPVILASTYSLAKCTATEYLYDLLIIDEASQVNMASAILSLAKARRIVVVGDLKQLPQIDDPRMVKLDRQYLEQFQIPGAYRYCGNNILRSFKLLLGDRLPETLLKEHYRCQKDIVDFSNRRFYQDQLICLTTDDGEEEHLSLIHTVPGHHARKNSEGSGLYNQREIDEVVSLVKKADPAKSLAVITPYRHQADILRKLLPDSVPVDTIHKFQGRECDEVIFSTVANDAEDFYQNQEIHHSFVNNAELLNVAMTRAKHRFTLVTSDQIYRSSTGFLGDLIRYMAYETHTDVSEGWVKSIFDILYADYSRSQEKLLKESRKEEEITETLLFDLLGKIFKDEEFASYRFAQHVPLAELISFVGDYSPEERRYLTHPWTHIDFVVYNIYDKKPVLLIEVDGVAFHEQKPKQRQHDAWKDEAVQRSHLKLLRLKTNGSEEEQKIRIALEGA